MKVIKGLLSGLLALLICLAMWGSALWAALLFLLTDCVEAPIIWLMVAVGMELHRLRWPRGEA